MTTGLVYPLVVSYTVRAEPQWLVDGLRQNVAWADQFVEVDNRAQTGGWGHEGEMRKRQRAQIKRDVHDARELAGCWVLQLDPDERLEDRAATVVPEALDRLERQQRAGRFMAVKALAGVSLSFPLREMWTPTAYRVDGGWCKKKPRARLFFFAPVLRQHFGNRPIHQGIMPSRAPGDTRVRTDVCLYHLKSIEPLNRVRRAAAYLAADPTFAVQQREGKDWTWLYDEDGLELEEIAAGREFTPAYSRPYEFVAPH